MKLNLGCDFDYKEKWVNLDQHTNLKCDVVHNLNSFPYPFKDNEFDFILANHVLEHLEDIPRVMKELYRISKNLAIIKITVPYFNSFNAFRDVTHIRFFNWDTFSPFCGFVSSKESKNVGYLDKLFEYRKRKLNWGSSNKPFFKQFCKFMDFLVNINPEFMERRFPFFVTVEALNIELIVKK